MPQDVYQEYAGHDVGGNLGVGRIQPVGAVGRPEVVAEAGFEQVHQLVGVLLNGAGLPDGRGQPGDADLDQALLVVVGEEVGVGDERADGRQHGGQVHDDQGVVQREQVARLHTKKGIERKVNSFFFEWQILTVFQFLLFGLIF